MLSGNCCWAWVLSDYRGPLFQKAEIWAYCWRGQVSCNQFISKTQTKRYYSCLRFWRSDIEGGILNRELSFRYSAVRCWSFQRAGERFLIVPVISSSGQDVLLPPATSSGLSIWCDLLRSNLSIPPRPINIMSRIRTKEFYCSLSYSIHTHSRWIGFTFRSLEFDRDTTAAWHTARACPHQNFKRSYFCKKII